MVEISVVIPTWQRAEWLQLCLASMWALELHPTEVLVVGRREDREARELTELCATRAPFLVRWLEVVSPGHIAPVVRGLADAEGDVVAFLDDDCEPEPAWLSELVKPFADATVAAVGGRVLTPGFQGKLSRDAGSIRWYGQHVGNIAALDLDEACEVAAVMEGNWAWRTDVLRSLDFDAALDQDDASMYGLDLCLQAKELGYSIVYEPRALVLHHVAPREQRLDREDRVSRSISYARNYTYIGLKHFVGLRRVAFRVWWWGIGERGAYAALTALVDTMMRRPGVRERLVASMQGRREGLLLWRSR